MDSNEQTQPPAQETLSENDLADIEARQALALDESRGLLTTVEVHDISADIRKDGVANGFNGQHLWGTTGQTQR